MASWEEYLDLPLTRYEIIDGEVFELPNSAAAFAHAPARPVLPLA